MIFLSLSFNQTATEPPFIMAVKEDGLWSKPLNSFGPGEFLSSDIGNVSGKHQVPCILAWQISTLKTSWAIQQIKRIKCFGIRSITKEKKYWLNYTASDTIKKMSVLQKECYLLFHRMWGYLMIYACFRETLIYFSCILICHCRLTITAYIVHEDSYS